MGETPNQSPEPVVLTVCTTCRQTGSDPEAMRPGRILADRLAGSALPEGVTVRGVECLACSRSCTCISPVACALELYLRRSRPGCPS